MTDLFFQCMGAVCPSAVIGAAVLVLSAVRAAGKRRS